MKKLFLFSLVLIFVNVATTFSQQFVQEWEIEKELTYVGDIDGDGIGEFVDYDRDNLITTFYDGQNHDIKWTITDKDFEDNIFDADATVHPAYLKFPSMDFNGDGNRDFFFNSSDRKGILIVDVVHNSILFEWYEQQIDDVQFLALTDVDGDSILEMIFISRMEAGSNDIYKTYIYSTTVNIASATKFQEKFPNNYKLNQNYPNPFNPTTNIEYEISQPENIKINIYDVTGRLVKELVNENKNSGKYTATWNGRDNFGNVVASGSYFYQIISGDFVQAKKMILLK